METVGQSVGDKEIKWSFKHSTALFDMGHS